MKNISPVASTLDSLLRQSVAALAHEDRLDDDIRIRFDAAFDRIRRFYRATETIMCQCVVEHDGAMIDIDHRQIRCPRLLVQCQQLDAPVSRTLTLTFAYVPDRTDRIALYILHANANFHTSQIFQWMLHEGWCTADGRELAGGSHAGVVRRAVLESDLFTSSAMELEPIVEARAAQ